MPTKEEVALADRAARGEVARLGFLVLLKAFQRLGYFVQVRDVPPVIAEYIAHTQGFLVTPGGLAEYDESGTRQRHVAVIRAHQKVKLFDTGGQVALARAVREAAHVKEDLADIIHEAKIDKPRERYVVAAFCYGCNLGPSQTARSLKDSDRRQIAWENLLSEYHLCYGGYGGIGYYHVSDMYIALFSHFIPCGVWEAVHILGGLLKNRSAIQPDTLHADTQGQNAPVFGLAHGCIGPTKRAGMTTSTLCSPIRWTGS